MMIEDANPLQSIYGLREDKVASCAFACVSRIDAVILGSASGAFRTHAWK